MKTEIILTVRCRTCYSEREYGWQIDEKYPLRECPVCHDEWTTTKYPYTIFIRIIINDKVMEID